MTNPVQRLVTKDRAHQKRIFRFGTDSRQQGLGRSQHLSQDPLLTPGLLDELWRVDQIRRLEIELLLRIQLKEFFEFGRLLNRAPAGSRGRFRRGRRLPALLGRGRYEGEEHC